MPAAFAADDERRQEVDPLGIWNCLIYGPYGDQRVFIRLSENRAAHMARIRDASGRRWTELSPWRKSRRTLSFEDPLRGREFEAALERATLGGTWRTEASTGGWWCSRAGDARPGEAGPPSPDALMPALVPAVVASPRYPMQALREAKEGRAVSCFLVNGNGEISHADLVELSDEVFRETTLAAITSSRYQGRDDEHGARPACRSFTFELEATR